MELLVLTPKQALSKAFLKMKTGRDDMDRFKEALMRMLSSAEPSESEEFHKNLIADFLKKIHYAPAHFINTRSYTDLVIHAGPTGKTPVSVLMEVKKPTNKAEMMTVERPNAKALQELLLYYLRERIGQGNLDLRHLVVTNLYEWFIFDASVFERLFAQNKTLVRQFTDFEQGRTPDTKTDFFYRQIAAPLLEQVIPEMEFVHFSLADYYDADKQAFLRDDVALIPLFKILSPEHLLKMPFANDSNSLDRRFYSELLHIIGLTEVKAGGQKVIRRNEPAHRHSGTVLEESIAQLNAMGSIAYIENPEQFGATLQERLFSVALELSITWVNRILFLKLLEAQLLNYHKGEKAYAFLNLQKIGSFQELHALFFRVLAQPTAERSKEMQEAFPHVPYLNSSLFESTELERTTISIGNLQNNHSIPVFEHTVLKDTEGNRLTGQLGTLAYLFEFLNAYDFSSEGKEQIQEENKRLISASVLGLIFEKINGYKDGSFFTPGFITMYMCREAVRKAVVQKFARFCQQQGWAEPQSLDELQEMIPHPFSRKLANEIFDSLRICDPAVGSGHFLVSVLNELVALKSELRILEDKNGKLLHRYYIRVENDELVITDEEGDLFEYHPNNPESQRVQEGLFHAKQTIIEKCLFGVDINPNSVNICRLRLWIELLKHAYYKQQDERSVRRELETLPNIDINIRTGNSLVSRFALEADLSQALRKSKWDIQGYRDAVQTYRNTTDRQVKRQVERLMATIKAEFREEIDKNNPLMVKKRRLEGELFLLMNQTSVFELPEKVRQERAQMAEKIAQEISRLEAEIQDIRSDKLYLNAFEWRFEFPEVLAPDGVFTGFDVLVGNPPYIRQEAFTHLKTYLSRHYSTFNGTADLYVYFVELALRLLRPGGHFAFIIPNKWMRAGYGKPLRDFVKAHAIEELLDFGDLRVFTEATTYPCILQLSKSPARPQFPAANIRTLDYPKGMAAYVATQQIQALTTELPEEGWTIANREVQQLLAKLRQTGVPLSQYVEGKIFRGVLTGLNEAFVISPETRERLIAEDPASAEIIKPFLAGRDIKRYQQPQPERFLIFTRRGIQIEKYPAILRYLEPFKERLMPKPAPTRDPEIPGRKPGSYQWYELQDAVDYYQEFEKVKIVYPNICRRPEFTLDESCAYVNQKCFIITHFTTGLLGLLNSSLVFFLFKHILPKLRGDFYEPSYLYFKDFPIIADPTGRLDALTEELLTLRKTSPQASTLALEAEIDRMVYELYELTEGEIAIIENQE